MVRVYGYDDFFEQVEFVMKDIPHSVNVPSYTSYHWMLQYYMDTSGTVSSFNYDSEANSLQNSIGGTGTRQIANQQYVICVCMGAGMCSIRCSQVTSDAYSFTLTGDVGVIDPALLGTASVQVQYCITDFIIIPNPTQDGI